MKRGNSYILLIAIISLTSVLTLSVLNFLRPYPPSKEAYDSLSSSNEVIYSFKDGTHIFTPEKGSEIGIVFYPGGLVDPVSYAPLLKRIATRGVSCFLVEMPLNLAVLSPNRAGNIMKDNPEIRRWILAGHSLGGSMAAKFAYDNQGRVDGLILLASYPGKDTSLSESGIHVLSIYGSNDKVLDIEALESGRALLPEGTTYVALLGGNHAQFGYYGPQRGDGDAFITLLEQQEMTVSAVLSFIYNAM
ncbi:MAG: alpha/beta hydrolase [Kosmotogaceae bacterium]|nr:alpha/beta hydrolase [Kosmotogaceae bacterium]